MSDPDTDVGLAYLTFPSPLGELTVLSSTKAILKVSFFAFEPPYGDINPDARRLARTAREQIEAFLRGDLRRFDLPVEPSGTAFQQAVWERMRSIDYGQTLSYGELAQEIGASLGASRAIGLACGANPIVLILPCHRVLASGGQLGGFGGGLERKRWLLHLETFRRPPGELLSTADPETVKASGSTEQLAFDFGSSS